MQMQIETYYGLDAIQKINKINNENVIKSKLRIPIKNEGTWDVVIFECETIVEKTMKTHNESKKKSFLDEALEMIHIKDVEFDEEKAINNKGNDNRNDDTSISDVLGLFSEGGPELTHIGVNDPGDGAYLGYQKFPQLLMNKCFTDESYCDYRRDKSPLGSELFKNDIYQKAIEKCQEIIQPCILYSGLYNSLNQNNKKISNDKYINRMNDQYTISHFRDVQNALNRDNNLLVMEKELLIMFSSPIIITDFDNIFVISIDITLVDTNKNINVHIFKINGDEFEMIKEININEREQNGFDKKLIGDTFIEIITNIYVKKISHIWMIIYDQLCKLGINAKLNKGKGKNKHDLYDKLLQIDFKRDYIKKINEKILKSIRFDFESQYPNDHLKTILCKAMKQNKKEIQCTDYPIQNEKYVRITKYFHKKLFDTYTIIDGYYHSSIAITDFNIFVMMYLNTKSDHHTGKIGYYETYIDTFNDYKTITEVLGISSNKLLINVTFVSSLIMNIYHTIHNKRMLIGKGNKIMFDVITHQLLHQFEYEFEASLDGFNDELIPYITMEYENIDIKINPNELKIVSLNCFSDDKMKTFTIGITDTKAVLFEHKNNIE